MESSQPYTEATYGAAIAFPAESEKTEASPVYLPAIEKGKPLDQAWQIGETIKYWHNPK